MDEDEKKAREALQAIVDDKDADEKSKARARRALAAMDDDGEKDESAESEGDDEEGKKDDEEASAASAGASVSAATAGAIASQASSVEARLVALEREREAEKRSELLASRPDLAPGLVKVLSTKPLAEVKSIVAAIPAPKRPKLGDHAAAASATGTRGENQGGDGRGDQQPPAQAAAMDRAMGLASTKLGVKREGTRLFLGASLPAK